MTTPSLQKETASLRGLVERLEAEEPAIALDAELFWMFDRPGATRAFWRAAMGMPRQLPEEFSNLPRGLGRASLECAAPNYTASLDTALALAERVLPGQEYEITTLYGVARVSLNLNHGEHGGPFYGQNVCGFAPLAICAAVVKARSTGEGAAR